MLGADSYETVEELSENVASGPPSNLVLVLGAW